MNRATLLAREKQQVNLLFLAVDRSRLQNIGSIIRSCFANGKKKSPPRAVACFFVAGGGED